LRVCAASRKLGVVLDSLPPDPPADYVRAPGDIYPRGPHEAELCARASHPDWLYLGGLAALDVASVWFGSEYEVKYSTSAIVRLAGPAAIGFMWGATVTGALLSVPKCDPRWVGETPREGQVREIWPLALSLTVLAAATAPIVNAIASGYTTPHSPICGDGGDGDGGCGANHHPLYARYEDWTTTEREMHVLVAIGFGAVGAVTPYLLPPRTWSAAKELDRIRFGTDGRTTATVGYRFTF
jgi:hypothetical protein